MASPQDRLETAVAAIKRQAAQPPRVALILGSGLGAFADSLENTVSLSYDNLPGFPPVGVQGHSGRLVHGSCAGVTVLAQQGRLHLYEGYTGYEVAFPLRVMRALGAEILIVTNAAGGLHAAWPPGTLMVMEDHINFQFQSPLRGRGKWVEDTRFVDLASPFDPALIALARREALHLGFSLQVGTYFGNQGPAYETPAEVRMIRSLGGDAVGMSTVQEVITARQLNMRVLGISCITNAAAGLGRKKLDHREVLKVAVSADRTFGELLRRIIPRS